MPLKPPDQVLSGGESRRESRPATDPLARYAVCQQQRRQLEGRLAGLKQEAAALEQLILDDWAQRGQRSAAVDGLCVFVRAEMYCSKKPEVSGQDLARALMRLGLGQIVSYNATNLKHYLRRRLAAASEDRGALSDDDIPEGILLAAVVPPELAAMINVGENVRLRTRRSK